MHKDFDAAAREAVGEPVTFKLGGETFTCTPEIPAIPLMRLSQAGDKGGVEAIAAFDAFLKAVLIEADVERFAAMATRERIGFDALNEVVAWIVEEAVGRPTERPSDSAEQPSSSSASLTAVSSPPETPEASSA